MHADLTKKEFGRFCVFDAREQIALIGANGSNGDRIAAIGAFRGWIGIWEFFILALILLLLFALFSAMVGVVIGTSSAAVIVITGVVGVLILGGIGWYAVRLARTNIRFKKLQRLARARIDERLCPCCEQQLDQDEHPTDGALVCEGCGLAWDSATDRRRHHSRKRVPDERYKNDPVFLDG